MSAEQLKAFLEKVQRDTSLQVKLKAAKSSDDVVSLPWTGSSYMGRSDHHQSGHLVQPPDFCIVSQASIALWHNMHLTTGCLLPRWGLVFSSIHLAPAKRSK